MSPHQRLILQESWKALEDAGYDIKSLAGTSVGIFIGAEPCGYASPSFTGASEAIIAARLAYLFNLKGPAMLVNTACSSSGVAIHLACESLRHGESALALAGGVFATLTQSTLDSLVDIGMVSPDGRCSTFDAVGNGTVLAEGVGVVVLKRLADAIADGDAIYGVICGSGVNQDGTTTHMAFGQNLARPDFIVLYPDSFVVQGSVLTSARMPSGASRVEIGNRADFAEVRDFYLARLAEAGFDVVDRGIAPLSPLTAAYLGIAGRLAATRASTDDFVSVVIRTPDGIIASRLVELSWGKISERSLPPDGSMPAR